jgi:hypothetical protein
MPATVLAASERAGTSNDRSVPSPAISIAVHADLGLLQRTRSESLDC